MKCPNCYSVESKVIDSRPNQTGMVTRRRRFCDDCGFRFTTYERIEEIVPLVVKNDSRREAFSRDKITGGISKACEKRPIETNQIEKIADEVIKEMQKIGEKEIHSKRIGYMIMNKLRLLDEVAYIRFAAVYRQFRDIDGFIHELQKQLEFPIDDPASERFPFRRHKIITQSHRKRPIQ